MNVFSETYWQSVYLNLYAVGGLNASISGPFLCSHTMNSDDSEILKLVLHLLIAIKIGKKKSGKQNLILTVLFSFDV